jgi:hydroquinone glucosyltransferase
MEAKAHIALVSIPVFSHQVSILEFAKQLIHLYKNTFHVTCIIPTISDSSSIASKPFFDTLPSNIQCIFLPPTNFEDLRKDLILESQIQISVSRSMPLVYETLRSISTSSINVVAIIVDSFAYEAHKFAKELNILSYSYFPCSAMVLSMCLYSSKLDESITCEYKDHPHPIEIPGESN